ncbi:ribosomal RNA-processing protein 8 isoform 2-T2 [Liasis olivaceus]
MSSIAPRAPPRSAGCGCSAPPLPPRPPRRTRPPPGGNGGPGQDAAATSGRQGARAASPGPERCVTSGARVPARRARTMPAREALAAHSPAGSRGLSLGRPSPLPRQRLLDALRRRPGRGAPRGALRGPPGSEGRGGGGHNGARGAEAPEPSERPVPGEKRGGRRGPGEAAAEGSLGSGTRRGSAGGAAEELRQRLTRKQWRSRQKNKRRPKNKFKAIAGVGSREPSGSRPPASSAAEEPPDGRGGLVLDTEAPSGQTPSLRQRLESRLDAARFRYINQQLYTRSSQEAAQLFQEDPEALAVYHRGFALQAARWPERPVERFVRYLRRRPASLVVADFGCGDCTLARSLPNRVHCFDLAALDSRVTVCDMAQVPRPGSLCEPRPARPPAHPPGRTIVLLARRCPWKTPPWTWPSSAWRSWGPTCARSWERRTASCEPGGRCWWPRWQAASRTCGPSWGRWPGWASGWSPRTSRAATSTPSSCARRRRRRRRKRNCAAWHCGPASTSAGDALPPSLPPNKGSSCSRVAAPVWLSGKCRRGG